MIGIVIFAIFSGVLLNILVGLVGSRRNIGFGWAFIISLLTTPIIGLIITLLSNPLPQEAAPKYGCLGHTFNFLGIVILILTVVFAFLLLLAFLA